MLFILFTLTVSGQTLQRDTKGNYHKIVNVKAVDAKTIYTYSDENGIVYPIYKSVRGKFYYFRRAKSGNIYKCYLPEGN